MHTSFSSLRKCLSAAFVCVYALAAVARGAELPPRSLGELQESLNRLREHYSPCLRSLPPPLKVRAQTPINRGWRSKFEIEKAKDGTRPQPPEWYREDLDDSTWEETVVPEWRYSYSSRTRPHSCILWYRTRFPAAKPQQGQRVFLVFEGVDWEAEVWLNGRRLGSHRVYCEPFRFDVTSILKGENTLAVRVIDGPLYGEPCAYWSVFPVVPAEDQRYVRDKAKSIRGHKTGDSHIGSGYGIHREVYLETTGAACVTAVFARADLEKNAARVAVETDASQAASCRLVVEVMAENSEGKSYSAEQQCELPEGRGRYELSIPMQGAQCWSPSVPRLYRCRVWLKDAERVIDAGDVLFGWRSFAMVGKDGRQDGLQEGTFLLNGEPVFLRGTNVQGLNALWYWGETERLIDVLLMLKAAGFNSVRSCQHVQFPEVRELMDRLGIMSEQDQGCRGLKEKDTGKHLVSAASALARECYNNPGVVLLSLANETRFDPTSAVRAILDVDPERVTVPVSGYTCGGTIGPPKGAYPELAPELWGRVVVDFHPYHGWYGWQGQIWRLAQRLEPGRMMTVGEYGSEALDSYETMSKRYPAHFGRTPSAYADALHGQVQVKKSDRRQIAGFHGRTPTCLAEYIEASQTFQADQMAELTKSWRLSPRRISGYFQFHFTDVIPANWPKSIVSHDLSPKHAYFEMAQVNQEVVALPLLDESGGAMEIFVANDLPEALARHKVQWSVSVRGRTCVQGEKSLDIPAADAVLVEKVDLMGVPENASLVDVSLLVSDADGNVVSRYEREVFLRAWREKSAIFLAGADEAASRELPYDVFPSFRAMAACAEPRMPKAVPLTSGPKIHWFGYYDIFEFDSTDRYVLCMESDFENRSPKPEDEIRIGMIDLEDGNRWTTLATTKAWCWQQGCRLQWRPRSESEIIWNDREGDRFVCHVMDVRTGKRSTLPYPVYDVSPDGKWALGTDFSRINETRVGYGYAGIPDRNRDVPAPEDVGVYSIDLDTGDYKLLFSVAQIAKLRLRGKPATKKLYFNHIEWNTDGRRFFVFSRGLGGIGTEVYSASADGGDIRHLASGSSHYCWRDPQHVLIWAWGAYRLYKDDGSGNGKLIWSAPNGHHTYLPGGDWLVTDTYPMGKSLFQHLYLYHVPTGSCVPLGRFRSPPAYRGEWRCDLHPRINRDGTKVVIDSPHGENGRQIYMIDIAPILKSPPTRRQAAGDPDAPKRDRAACWIEAETAQAHAGINVDASKAGVASADRNLGVHSDKEEGIVCTWKFRTKRALKRAELRVRHAGESDCEFRVLLDGKELKTVKLKGTGGWGYAPDEWRWQVVPLGAAITEGEHELHLIPANRAPANLDCIVLTEVGD